MKSLLFLTLSVHLTSAATHSLQYLYTAVTLRINFPEFSVVGQVDGQQIVYYDSNIRKMIPKTGWMRNNEDEDYWNSESQISERHEENFRTSVDNLMQRFNQTEGVHTVQWMYGCELHDDGTKRGYMQYSYDGEDFISLDLNTLTWTAANQKAVITKQKWESVNWAAQVKNYLENTCFRWLNKYVGYGRSTLERKVSPEASLFQKDSSSPVVCHATGFFPKAVMISWQKNGEDLHEDVELRETLPNQDGTFQKRSVLTVSPEELNRHDYTCIIQHSGLEKEVVLHSCEHAAVSGEVSCGRVFGIIISAILAVVLLLWMMKKSEPSDESVLTKVIFSPVDYEPTEME
ncbi:H-2 class I histocompatibility antigen, Q9 alpha chain-like [Colossoma macropomum]|uniref:H-2 class I histocompatibility antigen, Q9 alpha chain-like n=1 Tax=Colossoma macropomum TaxID=42526 RepID=UPI00186553F1|nr:H-2 class I histocompatibility antigen, Q9 alpha chain-like [Colossoma macropomum]